MALALLPGAASAADEKVWSAVVLASKAKKGSTPMPPPAELAAFAPKLATFFGYDQFEILGAATTRMDAQTERWLVPTRNFWVSAKATREEAGYRMHLEFFHDNRRLVETDAKLGLKSPLFVRGPVHPRGQLLVVFEVKP
jgi:hypothetical protein